MSTSGSVGSRRAEVVRRSSTEPRSEIELGDATVLELRDLLQIYLAICQTIQYAHEQGVLHRDIKPSNVIHGQFGETIVIDWGLAQPYKVPQASSEKAEGKPNSPLKFDAVPKTGFAGTPAFMSPEQAMGNVPLTPASDVFSLGAMLYFLLTGQPPYEGSSATEVRQKAIDGDFERPAKVCPGLPLALDAICCRAMSRQVSERYQSTSDLISDLNNYIADRPVSVLPDSVISGISRWIRHNSRQVLIGMLCLSTLAFLVAIYASVERFQRYETLRDQQAQVDETNKQKEMREREELLRREGILIAADLAARNLANRIDVLYRILESETDDVELRSALRDYNESSTEETRVAAQHRIQSWLNDKVSTFYPDVDVRSWFAMSDEGTTLAVFPEYKEDSRRHPSIGRNFAFRDYFHGLGNDLKPNTVTTKPLKDLHNSTATISTADGAATVTFSAPVFADDSHQERLGILAIVVRCGQFLNLEYQQPENQRLLVVEGRGYPMLPIRWNEALQLNEQTGDPTWGEGLVLQHDKLSEHAKAGALPPRIDRRLLETMRSSKSENQNAQLFSDEDQYVDPIEQLDHANQLQRWIAAYAPVILESRDAARASSDTGWFVIVQQRLREDVGR